MKAIINYARYAFASLATIGFRITAN